MLVHSKVWEPLLHCIHELLSLEVQMRFYNTKMTFNQHRTPRWGDVPKRLLSKAFFQMGPGKSSLPRGQMAQGAGILTLLGTFHRSSLCWWGIPVILAPSIYEEKLCGECFMQGEEREEFIEVGKRESGGRDRGWGKWASDLVTNTVQRMQTYTVLCWWRDLTSTLPCRQAKFLRPNWDSLAQRRLRKDMGILFTKFTSYLCIQLIN